MKICAAVCEYNPFHNGHKLHLDHIKNVIKPDYTVVIMSGNFLERGDVAVIDFKGFIGDEAFEGGEATKHHLILGSGSFIPGFEDQIIGHKIGDKFDVNVKFPENYHAENLKGKPVYFTIDLDCLDPSAFPGTGTPEAGGVTFTQLLHAIEKVCEANVVAADVNELAPMLDASGASTAMACKVLRELMLALLKNKLR